MDLASLEVCACNYSFIHDQDDEDLIIDEFDSWFLHPSQQVDSFGDRGEVDMFTQLAQEEADAAYARYSTSLFLETDDQSTCL